MRFGTFVVVMVLATCAVAGVFHPLFGVIVFGVVGAVLAGILLLVTRFPVRRQ